MHVRAITATCAVLLLAAGCSRPIEGPAFRTDSLRADFGHLWEGETRHHVFRLESAGTEPIAVEQRLDACGCTSVEWYEVEPDGSRAVYERGAPIEPGNALEVELTFDSRGRSGEFEKAVSLYGEFQSGKIELVLAAQIDPVLVLDGLEGGAPPMEAALSLQQQALSGSADAAAGRALDLGTTRPGVRASVRADLTSRAGPLVLHVGNELPQGLHATIAPVDPDADGRSEHFRLELVLGEEATSGYRIGDLELASDRLDGNGEPLRSWIRVTARVAPLVEPLQPNLDLGTVASGVRTARATGFRLESPAVVVPGRPMIEVRAALETSEGEVDVSDWFSAVWSADGGAPTLSLWADALPPGRSGPFEGVAIVHLGLDEQEEVEVRFTGTATGLDASGARVGADGG
ncbi:MAG: DUF1573 domain-containing protein [Planctomycetota bacterium]